MKSRVLENQPPKCRVNIEPVQKVNHVWLEPLFGGILSLLTGLLVLWLYLTVVGVIRLGGATTLVIQSPGLTICIASWVAVMLCGIGLPLMLPWFLALMVSEFLLPRNSIFWKWWVRTTLGMVVGVLAVWIDAAVYSMIGSGTLFAINVPLLRWASLPAAILGGAACFSAAAGARCLKVVSSV